MAKKDKKPKKPTNESTEKHERRIEKLEAKVKKLKKENSRLKDRVADAEVALVMAERAAAQAAESHEMKDHDRDVTTSAGGKSKKALAKKAPAKKTPAKKTSAAAVRKPGTVIVQHRAPARLVNS